MARQSSASGCFASMRRGRLSRFLKITGECCASGDQAVGICTERTSRRRPAKTALTGLHLPMTWRARDWRSRTTGSHCQSSGRQIGSIALIGWYSPSTATFPKSRQHASSTSSRRYGQRPPRVDRPQLPPRRLEEGTPATPRQSKRIRAMTSLWPGRWSVMRS